MVGEQSLSERLALLKEMRAIRAELGMTKTDMARELYMRYETYHKIETSAGAKKINPIMIMAMKHIAERG